MRTVTREQITEQSVLKAVALLTAPMLIGAVLQNLQSLIDLFWVGRLGAEAVASVAMAGTILMVLFPMLMGLSMGTVALVARAIGAGDTERAGLAAGQSLLLSVGLALGIGMTGFYFSDSFLRMLSAPPEVIPGGSAYLRISMLGAFTVFALFIGNAALQGAGDTFTPMKVMATSNILNIVLTPIFIFGLGPMPAMGIRGAALSTVIAQGLAATFCIRILLGGNARIQIKRHHFRLNTPVCLRILRIGLPGSGQMLSRSLMGAVMMWVVATAGTAAVAAYGIGLRFHMIVLMPSFALGGAAATMVGQNLGAGKPARARQAAWAATFVGIGFMIVSAAIMIAFAPSLIRIFNSDPEVVTVGSRYLKVVSPFYAFAALGIVLGRALNGAGDTVGPMIITIVTLWGLQIPLALSLARVLSPSTDGIWWAIAAAFVVQGLLILAWFEKGKWKHKQI